MTEIRYNGSKWAGIAELTALIERNTTSAEYNRAMAIHHLTTAQILRSIQHSTSVSRDSDTGQKWIWAGSEDDKNDKSTTACRELERRGVLTDHDTIDGYHVWEITPEWRNKIS